MPASRSGPSPDAYPPQTPPYSGWPIRDCVQRPAALAAIWALRREAWSDAVYGAVGLETAPGASHSLRMSDVQQEGGPRWVNRIVCLGRCCWTWTAWRSPRPTWWVANGSSPSRPRLRSSAAWAAACGPLRMADGWCGCGTCRSAAGRWCCGGASGSGAVVSRPVDADLDERTAAILPRAVLTERARAEAC
jgi:hypothetical protein